MAGDKLALWHVDGDGSEGSLHVYRRDTVPRDVPVSPGLESELAAWEYGLDCMVMRRDRLAATIKDARQNIRRLKALNPKPEGEG